MLVAGVLATTTRVMAATTATAIPPYKDPSLPVATRARDLLARMTLDEKVGQTLHPWLTATPAEYYAKYNKTTLGAAYLSMCCAANVSAAAVIAQRNAMQKLFVEGTRLGIPATFVMETLHSGAWGGTVFPMPVNYGAAWNTTALELSQRAAAAEARAIGADRGFSPVINMFPDPRYGRTQEGYSADPFLTTQMGLAAVRGLQGAGGPTEYLVNPESSLVATVKHYAAYGKTAGGIDGSPADISEQTLRESYLAPWEALAREGLLRSVMAAQNAVNGRPMHANRRLLTGILRDEWGVPDVLVESDGGDCIGALQYGFHMAGSIPEAAVMGVDAGMDMDLGGTTMATLAATLSSNEPPPFPCNKTEVARAVDRAAYNVLASKFAAGLFDKPYVTNLTPTLDTAANRRLAREVAEQSLVLLQNKDGFLPLGAAPSSYKKVAVVGPLADSASDTLGSYFNWDGATVDVVTVQDAVAQAFAGTATAVATAKGCNAEDGNTTMLAAAEAAAKGSDLVVLVLGDTAATCGEMVDRSDLDLPGGQLELMDRVLATGAPTVVVLIHGRPATFGMDNNPSTGIAPPPRLDAPNLKAVLTAWRPGEEGGTAVWNTLTGASNPTGRLAQAWPRTVGQISGPGQPYIYPYQGNHQHEAYCVDGASNAQYGMGYGLSYSEVEVTTLSATPASAPATGTFTVTATVTNKGAHATGPHGAVVQLFCNDPVSRNVVRLSAYWLCGFARSPPLAPGARATVALTLPVRELSYYDDGKNNAGGEAGWRVDVGTFNVYAATDGFGSPGSWEHLQKSGGATAVEVTTARDV